MIKFLDIFFRPHFTVSQIETENLKKLMETWLQDVSKDTKNHLQPVFDIVTTVKTIHNIKTEAFAIGNCYTSKAHHFAAMFDCVTFI